MHCNNDGSNRETPSNYCGIELISDQRRGAGPAVQHRGADLSTSPPAQAAVQMAEN
jgi:hypothetical protein